MDVTEHVVAAVDDLKAGATAMVDVHQEQTGHLRFPCPNVIGTQKYAPAPLRHSTRRNRVVALRPAHQPHGSSFDPARGKDARKLGDGVQDSYGFAKWI
jgi:hypothetical protein